ncbi:MAG: hypothetical protein JW804_03750 [Sedimentisphaerales bacterium]|nr:hypothetical protein [Sedimentisphaerales bacterium]
MKRCIVLEIFVCALLIAFCGCDSKEGIFKKPVKLTKEGFPEVMMGVWEADVSNSSKWGIKFESNGSITKIIHSVAGPINIEEGGVSHETSDGSYYIFTMGPCDAEYNSKTNILKVKIIIENFVLKIHTGELVGRSEDYIEGLVSEDGKLWKADWVSLGWLEGAEPPPIELLKSHPIPLVFEKVNLDELKKKIEENEESHEQQTDSQD